MRSGTGLRKAAACRHVLSESPIPGVAHRASRARDRAAVNRLNSLLAGAVVKRAIVQVQGPLRLSDFSEPQPRARLACTSRGLLRARASGRFRHTARHRGERDDATLR